MFPYVSLTIFDLVICLDKPNAALVSLGESGHSNLNQKR